MPLQYNRDKSEKPSNSKGLEDFRHEFFTLFQVKKAANLREKKEACFIRDKKGIGLRQK
jgi:hypothetical protein